MRRLGGQIVDGGIDGEIAGDVPVVAVPPLAPGHVQMEDVLEQMFEQRPLLVGREIRQPGRIDAQHRGAVSDGHTQRGIAGSLPPTKAENEMAVKGTAFQQSHHRVFKIPQPRSHHALSPITNHCL